MPTRSCERRHGRADDSARTTALPSDVAAEARGDGGNGAVLDVVGKVLAPLEKCKGLLVTAKRRAQPSGVDHRLSSDPAESVPQRPSRVPHHGHDHVKLPRDWAEQRGRPYDVL